MGRLVNIVDIGTIVALHVFKTTMTNTDVGSCARKESIFLRRDKMKFLNL